LRRFFPNPPQTLSNHKQNFEEKFGRNISIITVPYKDVVNSMPNEHKEASNQHLVKKELSTFYRKAILSIFPDFIPFFGACQFSELPPFEITIDPTTINNVHYKKKRDHNQMINNRRENIYNKRTNKRFRSNDQIIYDDEKF
jgi:hypothetical protein